VEPPEDVGKGGDLWHGRAGAVDNLARADLQLESIVRDAVNNPLTFLTTITQIC
jgi:hypothetical protein